MFLLRLLGFLVLAPIVLVIALVIDLPIWVRNLVRWRLVLHRQAPWEKLRTAVHESGHAMMAWRSPHHGFRKAVLHPWFRIGSAGVCKAAGPGHDAAPDALAAHAAYAMGGIAAEAVLHGEIGSFDGRRLYQQPDTRMAVFVLLLRAKAESSVIMTAMQRFDDLYAGRGAAGDVLDIVGYLEMVAPVLAAAATALMRERGSLLALARLMLAQGVLRPADLRRILGPSALERAAPDRPPP